MSLEECQEFLLKPQLAVVDFLIRDVTPHCFCLGPADREVAVAVLPVKAAKLGELSMDPGRRARLNRPQNLGDGLVLP